MRGIVVPARALAWVVAITLASACDGGPSGPGTMRGTINGPVALGAVVLEITGVGIRGFSGSGDTQAYGAEVSAAEGRHRVILIDRAGGQIDFGIDVDDLGAEPPIVVVINATGTNDLSVATTDIEVRLER